jgi:3-hydroxyisobutyrate dehydrogenase-like beta-hydroxyacid dehydrogenase
MSENLTVGFLGVGAIGRPMAERLLDAGPVAIADINADARAAFAGRTPIFASARELGDAADMVFACLPSARSYLEAIVSDEGLVAGRRVRYFVNVGTTGPELTRQITSRLSARDILVLDAPVSGGAPRAREGSLMVMAAGAKALFALAEPMMRCYANSVVYLGEDPVLAQTMKLINNVLSAGNLAVALEVMILGARAGLDARQMIDVLNGGTGQNSATLTKIPKYILPRSFDYGGRLEIVHKDLKMFVDEAKRMGLASPLSELIEATYRAAVETEGAASDMTAVVRPLERAAGVQIGSPDADSAALGG